MKDVNDLMQAILEMDAAQRKVSEKAKLERTARLAALDEQKQKIIAECDAREKAACEAAAQGCGAGQRRRPCCAGAAVPAGRRGHDRRRPEP